MAHHFSALKKRVPLGNEKAKNASPMAFLCVLIGLISLVDMAIYFVSALPSTVSPNMLSMFYPTDVTFTLGGDAGGVFPGSRAFFMRTLRRYPWEPASNDFDCVTSAKHPTHASTGAPYLGTDYATVDSSGSFTASVYNMVPGVYTLCFEDLGVQTTLPTTTEPPTTPAPTTPPPPTTTALPTTTDVNATAAPTTTPLPTTTPVPTTTIPPTTTPAPTLAPLSWKRYSGITLTITGKVSPENSYVECNGTYPIRDKWKTVEAWDDNQCFIRTFDGNGLPTGSAEEACFLGACVRDGKGERLPASQRRPAEYISPSVYRVQFFSTVAGCDASVQAFYEGVPFKLNALTRFTLLPGPKDDSKALVDNCALAAGKATCDVQIRDTFGNPIAQCRTTADTKTCQPELYT